MLEDWVCCLASSQVAVLNAARLEERRKQQQVLQQQQQQQQQQLLQHELQNPPLCKLGTSKAGVYLRRGGEKEQDYAERVRLHLKTAVKSREHLYKYASDTCSIVIQSLTIHVSTPATPAGANRSPLLLSRLCTR